MPSFEAVLVGLVAIVLTRAALHDVATRRIPNWTSMLVALLGAVLRTRHGQLAEGLLAAGLVFGCMVLLWRRGWVGGGDVKLLAAITLLAPPGGVLNLLLTVSLAGGALAALYLALIRAGLPALRAGSRAAPRRVLRAELWRIRRRGPLPYACAISAGGLLTLFGG